LQTTIHAEPVASAEAAAKRTNGGWTAARRSSWSASREGERPASLSARARHLEAIFYSQRLTPCSVESPSRAWWLTLPVGGCGRCPKAGTIYTLTTLIDTTGNCIDPGAGGW